MLPSLDFKINRSKDIQFLISGVYELISAIYFPTSLPLIDTFEKKHRKVMEEVFKIASEALKAGEKGLDEMKTLPMLMTTEYQKFAAEFVQEMRGHLARNVPKLELDKP